MCKNDVYRTSESAECDTIQVFLYSLLKMSLCVCLVIKNQILKRENYSQYLPSSQ